MTKFKTDVKALYADFLCQFKGLVCATPVACSNHTFRSTFKPDLVLVDEVGRMRELSFYIPVTWFDAPVIAVGDYRQNGPTIVIQHDAENAVKSNNPYYPALSTSILERAVLANATDGYLYINHRQLGDLRHLPS